ncbi:MAG: translocation/assembly module TamB, partial [Bacteroidia bacterium]|nr:translocation/assembly module TamB [Bacteroidia bacterium]
SLKIHDPEGNFNTRVVYQWAKQPTFEMVGDIEQVDLKHYKISQIPFKFTSILNVELFGDSLENANGYVRFFNNSLSRLDSNRTISVKNFLIKTNGNTKEYKNIDINSRLFGLSLKGNFSYKQIIQEITAIVQETGLYLRNNPNEIKQYYSQKKLNENPIKFDFNLIIKNQMNDLLHFIGYPLTIADSSSFVLKFDAANDYVINGSLYLDSLQQQKIVGAIISLDFDLQKSRNSNQLNINTDFACHKLKIGQSFSIDDIRLQQLLIQRLLNSRISASQDSGRNQLQIALSTLFGDTTIDTKILSKESFLNLRNYHWTFSENNQILYQTTEKILQIRRFLVASEQQEIRVASNLKLDSTYTQSEDDFIISIKDLELEAVSKVLNLELPTYGTCNLDINLNYLVTQPVAQLNGVIQGFRYGKLRYGDVWIRSDWDERKKQLLLNVALTMNADTLLGLRGSYNPSNTRSPLNFSLTTNNLRLKLIEPFVKDILYDIRGSVFVEQLKITGTIDEPVLTGEGFFKNVSFGIHYFKAKYAFNGTIAINEDQIIFPQLTLYDQQIPDGKKLLQSGYVKFNGSIYHSYFRKFKLNLNLTEINNFLLFNTTKKDNDLFYGKAFIRDGFGKISGSDKKIYIQANVLAGAGSEINIPISSYTKGARLDYVYFKSKRQKDTVLVKKKVESLGFGLHLVVDVASDTDVNIIFDEKAGDIIHGKGTGTVTMDISDEGEFTMVGQYEVIEGEYLFTAENVIKKLFVIERGGTITWSGNPYNATLNIQAIYKVPNATIQTDTSATGTRRIPVDVMMKLQGSLFQPQISLSIEFPNLNQSDGFALFSKFRNIQNDPQELNRQVFSLLMFGRIAPEEGIFSSGAAQSGVTNSISELVSSQLNSWLGQALDNKIGVAVSSNTFNDVNLAVKMQLFQDRVTITRNGSIVNSRNRDLSVGNISMFIRLIPSPKAIRKPGNPGVLAVEIFNRENLGLSNSIISINRGVGIFFKKEFDVFFESFRRKKKIQNSTDLK